METGNEINFEMNEQKKPELNEDNRKTGWSLLSYDDSGGARAEHE